MAPSGGRTVISSLQPRFTMQRTEFESRTPGNLLPGGPQRIRRAPKLWGEILWEKLRDCRVAGSGGRTEIRSLQPHFKMQRTEFESRTPGNLLPRRASTHSLRSKTLGRNPLGKVEMLKSGSLWRAHSDKLVATTFYDAADGIRIQDPWKFTSRRASTHSPRSKTLGRNPVGKVEMLKSGSLWRARSDKLVATTFYDAADGIRIQDTWKFSSRRASTHSPRSKTLGRNSLGKVEILKSGSLWR